MNAFLDIFGWNFMSHQSDEMEDGPLLNIDDNTKFRLSDMHRKDWIRED